MKGVRQHHKADESKMLPTVRLGFLLNRNKLATKVFMIMIN